MEETILRLPVPREAVLIEVFGRMKSVVSNKISLDESLSPNLLTHLTVRNTIRPLTGGLRIYNPQTGYCTLGMIAKWGGNAVFITNAHCTNVFGQMQNDQFYQVSEYVGSEVSDVQFVPDQTNNRAIRYSDAAIVQLQISNYKFGTVAFTNGRGHNWGDNADSQKEIVHNSVPPEYRLTYIDEQESLINLPVVKTGYATGSTVGYVNRTCVTVYAAVSPYYQLLCQDIADGLYSKDGDSGSPVYTDYTSDIEVGEAKLVGLYHSIILDENENPTEEAVYSPVHGIREDLETYNLRLSFVPTSIGIFGNENIQDTGNYNYVSVVDNSSGSVSYQWSIQWEGNSFWNTLGSNPSQTVSIMDGDDFTLKVQVNDDNGVSTALYPVSVVISDCSPFEVCVE